MKPTKPQPKPSRRSIRLKGYDYSMPGAYFLTICAAERSSHIFGNIESEQMILNDNGMILLSIWNKLGEHFPHIITDEFAIMPNHVHGIIIIRDDAQTGGAKNDSLPIFVPALSKPANVMTNTKFHGIPEIMRTFKTLTARAINQNRGTPEHSVWQRSFYDHVIRSEDSLYQIREYIMRNPANWNDDEENPRV